MMLGALLFAQMANAAAPILSGPYAVTLTDTCQAVVWTSTDPKTGDVLSLNTISDGKLAQTVGTLTFDPTTQTALISGTMIKGSLLIVKGIPGSYHMEKSTISSSVSYSNTDSTLVIDTQTYSVGAVRNGPAGGREYAAW